MYIMYYDSGTTNTRAYLLKDGAIVRSMAKAIGAKNSALERDNTRLVGELYSMYEKLLADEQITGSDVSHVFLSGMISCPSGIVEVEHLPAPVDAGTLRENVAVYRDYRFFNRELEIIPGIKTLERGALVPPELAASVNIMRGEEIEVFGILRANPELSKGTCVFVLPGSHTQAVLVKDGRIEDISSNITGEFFKAITKESILGASVSGGEQWVIDHEMVRLGARNMHEYGFNRAMYILRILDLFTEADLNGRRSYFEGALNVGVMDAVSRMIEKCGASETETAAPGAVDENGQIRLAVVGDEIQKEIFAAFCEEYTRFQMIPVREAAGMPFSVSGLLGMIS